MTTTEELQNMEGQTAVDVNGAKLGKIGQIYVDDQTGQPLWVTITTGMFGTKQSFAPLHGSHPAGEDLHLAVNRMKGRPAVVVYTLVDPELRDALNQLTADLRGEIRSGDAETRVYVDAGVQASAAETRAYIDASAAETRRHSGVIGESLRGEIRALADELRPVVFTRDFTEMAAEGSPGRSITPL